MGTAGLAGGARGSAAPASLARPPTSRRRAPVPASQTGTTVDPGPCERRRQGSCPTSLRASLPASLLRTPQRHRPRHRPRHCPSRPREFHFLLSRRTELQMQKRSLILDTGRDAALGRRGPPFVFAEEAAWPQATRPSAPTQHQGGGEGLSPPDLRSPMAAGSPYALLH